MHAGRTQDQRDQLLGGRSRGRLMSISGITELTHESNGKTVVRGDVKIPTYKPQKAICELTYFSPNHHM